MNISFPSLGLEFKIERIAFYLFGNKNFPIYWYGIIIALGFTAGIFLGSIAAKKIGEKSDIAIDIALWGAPVAIVCARLYYVVFKFEDYKDNLLSVFDLRSGGIAIYGAVIGAVIGVWLFSKYKKKSMLKMFDIGAVGLITGQMIGRWGNFFNQEAFGCNTDLPWGMTSNAIKEYLSDVKMQGMNVNPDLPVHPTFLYESLWSLATLVLLFVIINKFYRYNGQVFFSYCFLYGLGRFWIEGLRTDSLMWGPFRVSQVLALVCVIVFGAIYIYRYVKNKKDAVKKIEIYEN